MGCEFWLTLCWILAALAASPQLFLWGTVEIPPDAAPGNVKGLHQALSLAHLASPSFRVLSLFQCMYKEKVAEAVFGRDFFVSYQVYHVVAVFYLPLLVIITAYIGIFCLLFRSPFLSLPPLPFHSAHSTCALWTQVPPSGTEV